MTSAFESSTIRTIRATSATKMLVNAIAENKKRVNALIANNKVSQAKEEGFKFFKLDVGDL